MNWLSIAAIYLLIWTVTLFAVLPFGVRSPDEAGAEKVKGQADSAPVDPMIGRKLIWTTIISALLMATFWAAWTAGLISLA
jgi:predicted secreted protein